MQPSTTAKAKPMPQEFRFISDKVANLDEMFCAHHAIFGACDDWGEGGD